MTILLLHFLAFCRMNCMFIWFLSWHIRLQAKHLGIYISCVHKYLCLLATEATDNYQKHTFIHLLIHIYFHISQTSLIQSFIHSFIYSFIHPYNSYTSNHPVSCPWPYLHPLITLIFHSYESFRHLLVHYINFLIIIQHII